MDNIRQHEIILKKNKKNILNSTLFFSKIIINAIKNKNKILIAGNGGSASDAQHIATEMTVRLKRNRLGLPFISLATDTSALTAIGNDFHFSKIFSRQIEAIGIEKDIFIAISTSGNSKNIVHALKKAKQKNLVTLGILGNNGGESKKYCDYSFCISEKNPSRVQEIHILFYHNFCEMVEEFFFKN